MTSDSNVAMTANAWPFEEARALFNEKLGGKVPEKGYVLFETGYGPSGLPHIGTFGEVARTTMVMNAFKTLYPGIPVRLFCVSDDMDGLRKVPDNIPNKEMVGQYLGKPLTKIPDPFGCHDSFGHHNNDCLKSFLDTFGFEYEFKSATELYTAGVYDKALLKVLENYEKVINVILPTLGEERRATYSPFLPVSPKTGNVLQVAITKVDKENGTVSFIDEDGAETTVPATNRTLQAAMESRLGDAVVRFGRRLRNVGQRPDGIGQTVRQNLPYLRGRSAEKPDIRAVFR